MSSIFCCPLPTHCLRRGRRYFRGKAQAPQIKVMTLPLSDIIPSQGWGAVSLILSLCVSVTKLLGRLGGVKEFAYR
jgi:hypothetical protein